MNKIIISLFILGLSFGWGPCMASCGPLLLSYIAGTKKGILKSFLVYALFSAARVSAYIALGLAVFFLGSFAQERLFSGVLYKYVLGIGGFFIVILGILMALGKRLEFKPWQFLYKNILEHDIKSIFILGLVIGFLPCAPMFAMLSYVGLVSKSWIESVFYSISFGIGTFLSPLILLVILAGTIPRFLSRQKEIYSRIFRAICGLIIIFLGLQLIIRAI